MPTSIKTISIAKDLIQAARSKLNLGVVISKVQVQKLNEELWKFLELKGQEQKEQYSQSKIEEIPQIQFLRNTYKDLGLKIADYKGSNESLIKRIITDKGLYQINNVVDVNNYVSIDSLRSVGSYDLAKLTGDVTFRIGQSGEVYTGTTKRPMQLKNLPLLADDEGPFGSPTSDSSRALITENTTDIMTVIFSFDGRDNLQNQLDQLCHLLTKFCNANSCQNYIVNDNIQKLNF